MLQGVGGAVELAPGYLPAAYDIIRKAGGLCIADEVQTGFGRTGTNYWGFQNQGVTPDIVTLAKVSNVLLCACFSLLFTFYTHDFQVQFLGLRFTMLHLSGW